MLPIVEREISVQYPPDDEVIGTIAEARNGIRALVVITIEVNFFIVLL
jgi:hypothetical protein